MFIFASDNVLITCRLFISTNDIGPAVTGLLIFYFLDTNLPYGHCHGSLMLDQVI